MADKYLRFKTVSMLLLAATMLTACEQAPQQTKAMVSRPVKLFMVGENSANRVFKFPGSVAAVKQADMAFEVPGRIIDFPVTEGELVQAGTVLATLDPTTYEAERDRARAERSAAQTDFHRYQVAFERKAVTKQQLDIARRNLDVAEASLRQANKILDDTILRAPFTGRLARKVVEDYANVQAKQTVLILQGDDALEMKVHVSETDWVRGKNVDTIDELEINSHIHVELSTLPGQMIPAKITSFSSMADPITRTFEVTVGFEAPEGASISPGMTGRVIYELPQEPSQVTLLVPTNSVVYAQFNLLLVPANAVLATTDKTSFVWLYDQDTGTVSQRIITLGDPVGDSIHVKSGLVRGDKIAVSGTRSLGDGYPVHAMQE
ncbi:efflux RND transporter periplasmic adaptor subunit [Photobacterium sp. TY1-4]|uniref:efflux RND transporter periplasmic adaptor subunit n=1 Tax=Photobacterium sp. TY1-4 TaxID=2899122 RepID=UPI0021BEFC35|nr:efflux RND transporter periplasmic adaptor subunit [Photobacterium sp. TY1-4]UXH99988.1 efflux RND transporter periplasmic adaptor subunit [Photobacterium sp. TY1-4]